MTGKASKIAALLNPRTLPCILVRSETHAGYWGVGPTLGEAVKAARWITRDTPVIFMECSPDAHCDEFGRVCAAKRGPVYIGRLNAQRNGIKAPQKLQD